MRGRGLLISCVLGVLTAAGIFLCVRQRIQARRSALPPQVRDYRPQPLADPAHIGVFLPAGLEDADAGFDWMVYFTAEEKASPSSEAALAAALRKSRCALTGASWMPPDSTEDYLKRISRIVLGMLAANKALKGRAEGLASQGRWEEALAAAKRQMLFGWHMMQDWDSTVQLLGGTCAVGALLTHQGIRRRQIAAAGRRDEPPDQLDSIRLALEIQAYLPDPQELRRIFRVPDDRGLFARFETYMSEPRLTRPYLDIALLAAAAGLSQEEAESARFWPERDAFLSRAAASPDRRVSALGAAYGRMLAGYRKELLAGTPVERRQLAAAVREKLLALPEER